MLSHQLEEIKMIGKYIYEELVNQNPQILNHIKNVEIELKRKEKIERYVSDLI
jgi:hypothetical protein